MHRRLSLGDHCGARAPGMWLRVNGWMDAAHGLPRRGAERGYMGTAAAHHRALHVELRRLHVGRRRVSYRSRDVLA
jgi:hypothetical protein